MNPIDVISEYSPFLLVMTVVAVFSIINQRRWAKAAARATDSLAAGDEVDVYCALRVPSEGRTWLGRRWRQGSIRRTHGGSLMFKPYRPRIAKSFDLTGARLIDRRPRTRLERLWFEDATVLIVRAPDVGLIELGFGPGRWSVLARSMLADSKSETT